MKAEVVGQLKEMGDHIAQPALTDGLVLRADQMTPTTTIETKSVLRKALWTLRNDLPQDQPLELRESYEKARNTAFDITWERGMRGWPNHYFITTSRPTPAQIPNYDDVEPGLARGGQPVTEGVNWLLAQGFKTEIDLRGDDRENQWAVPAWQNIQRYNIPVPDYGAPTFEQVDEFVKLAQDPSLQPTFVHCKAGLGRTGTMIACLHIAQGMDVEEALALEKINSYAGSLAQEAFVRAYAERIKGATPGSPSPG